MASPAAPSRCSTPSASAPPSCAKPTGSTRPSSGARRPTARASSAPDACDFDREWSKIMSSPPKNPDHPDQGGVDPAELQAYFVRSGRYKSAAFITTPHCASPPTASSLPREALFPPQQHTTQHPSKALKYPQASAHEDLPIRPERHVQNSIATPELSLPSVSHENSTGAPAAKDSVNMPTGDTVGLGPRRPAPDAGFPSPAGGRGLG